MTNWQTEWAYNKYWVMARSQQLYNAIRILAKNNDWSLDRETEFKTLLRSAEDCHPTKETLTTAYQHIWGYFKKRCTPDEKRTYLTLLAELTPENDRIGPFLEKMTRKYQIDYLLKSKIIKEIQIRGYQA